MLERPVRTRGCIYQRRRDPDSPLFSLHLRSRHLRRRLSLRRESTYIKRMAKKPAPEHVVAPDRQKLTDTQAARLGALTEIEAKELAGLTIADIRDRFAWRIDPELLFFRRICGKVVKKDPITGISYPVPFATVIVEDTDCNLLAFFPKFWQWGWFFPLFCRREVLATVKTDKCGKFCVWVPRWDIDWILRWRKHRICFPYIFTRPTIRALLVSTSIC